MQEFEVFRCRTCQHWRGRAINMGSADFRPCSKWETEFRLHHASDTAVIDYDRGLGPLTGPDFGCIQHSELQPAEAPPLTPQMRETLDRLNALVDARRAAVGDAARYYGSGDTAQTVGYGSSTSIDRLERPK